MFFGAREGVIEAAFHGIDCAIVIVDEEFTDFLEAAGERGTHLRDPRPDRTMKILVQPQKGGTYKLLFYDGRHTRGAAFVELMETPRGPRPTSTG